MPPTKTPQEFVATWKQATLKERSAAQPHFIGLCQIIGHPTPEEDDPTGERYAFEAGADRQRGGQGWADVWKRGCFAWEYKGKHADLAKAYQQLLQYRESSAEPAPAGRLRHRHDRRPHQLHQHGQAGVYDHPRRPADRAGPAEAPRYLPEPRGLPHPADHPAGDGAGGPRVRPAGRRCCAATARSRSGSRTS